MPGILFLQAALSARGGNSPVESQVLWSIILLLGFIGIVIVTFIAIFISDRRSRMKDK